MADKLASRFERLSGWQLLAEFAEASPPHRDRHLADQVTEAVQGLGLQPAQLEQIHEIFVQAVNRATQRGDAARPNYPVRARIWVLGICDGRGWGFFLVDKQSHDPQGVQADTDHLVELFLYQERDSPKA